MVRKLIALSPDLVKRISRHRAKARLPSDSETMRILIERGLAAEEQARRPPNSNQAA